MLQHQNITPKSATGDTPHIPDTPVTAGPQDRRTAGPQVAAAADYLPQIESNSPENEWVKAASESLAEHFRLTQAMASSVDVNSAPKARSAIT